MGCLLEINTCKEAGWVRGRSLTGWAYRRLEYVLLMRVDLACADMAGIYIPMLPGLWTWAALGKAGTTGKAAPSR